MPVGFEDTVIVPEFKLQIRERYYADEYRKDSTAPVASRARGRASRSHEILSGHPTSPCSPTVGTQSRPVEPRPTSNWRARGIRNPTFLSCQFSIR